MSKLYDEAYPEDPQAFWESVDPEYAHLQLGQTFNHHDLWGDWEREFIGRYQWEGSFVVDYGCGGGWLGKLLFEKYKISRYWGVDISERSLAFARTNCPNGIFMSVDKFNDLTAQMVARYADHFVCLNMIHHIPTIAGVRDVLIATEDVQAENVIMTIRNIGKPTYFQPTNPGNAFWTEPQFMRGLFSEEYDLSWKSAIEPDPSLRQYMGFKRRGE